MEVIVEGVLILGSLLFPHQPSILHRVDVRRIIIALLKIIVPESAAGKRTDRRSKNVYEK
jgi:hypothetical protein